MIIQLNNPITNYEDEPLEDKQGEKITYGKVIRQVCSTPREKEKSDEKLKRFHIGLKCVSDEADLDLDERKLIKDLMNEFEVGPVVYGRVCQLFEGEEETA